MLGASRLQWKKFKIITAFHSFSLKSESNPLLGSPDLVRFHRTVIVSEPTTVYYVTMWQSAMHAGQHSCVLAGLPHRDVEDLLSLPTVTVRQLHHKIPISPRKGLFAKESSAADLDKHLGALGQHILNEWAKRWVSALIFHTWFG